MATLARLMIELGLDESYSAGLASVGAKLREISRRLNYPNPKTQAEMWRQSYMEKSCIIEETGAVR